jgi:hypothetical protein
MIHASAAPKSTNEVTAKASLTQMINLLFSRMERFASLHFPESHKEEYVPTKKLTLQSSDQDLEGELPTEEVIPSVVSPAEAEPLPVDEKQAKLHILKLDVSLVLNYLCRLAVMTDDGNDVSPTNSFTTPDVLVADELSLSCIKDRALALELILSVLNNVGPVFRTEEIFFQTVKEHLCSVVSRNSITTNPVLFELSLSIFLLIIRFFRHKLKLEVEMQFVMYLQILEMGNSTYKQKSQILQGLLIICETPQVLQFNIDFGRHLFEL